MNGYNFTERVRRVLARAREEAVALGHQYVGCEHELLAILSDDGVASNVLKNLGADPPHVAATVKLLLKGGSGEIRLSGPDLPYTSRAKKVLEYAMNEATELGHSYVGTEHLLLGLLREKKGIAAQALNSLGVTLENARAETLRILGVEMSGTLVPPQGEQPTLVQVSLKYANGALVTQRFMSTAEAAHFLASR